MIAAILTALAAVASPTADTPGEPQSTTVCVVNAGMAGDGVPDAAPRLDCSAIMSCVVVDGMPGRDGAPDAVRLVVCQGAEQ